MYVTYMHFLTTNQGTVKKFAGYISLCAIFTGAIRSCAQKGRVSFEITPAMISCFVMTIVYKSLPTTMNSWGIRLIKKLIHRVGSPFDPPMIRFAL